MKANEILLLGTNSTKLNIRHIKTKVSKKLTKANPHIHNECEIYLNISGDIGFIAEKNLYDIKSGDIFITRPNEYHHCIIKQDCTHEHFWITFSTNGNDRLLSPFFQREAGHQNLISLNEQLRTKAIELCFKLLKSKDETEQYFTFFELLYIIWGENKPSSTPLPEDVTACIEYINKNYMKPISVKDLSQLNFVSLNTLERRFKKYIGITPMAYIQNRRFSNAISILNSGGTVMEAAFESGFPDYSHFIALFKKKYGKTPLQHQKEKL